METHAADLPVLSRLLNVLHMMCKDDSRIARIIRKCGAIDRIDGVLCMREKCDAIVHCIREHQQYEQDNTREVVSHLISKQDYTSINRLLRENQDRDERKFILAILASTDASMDQRCVLDTCVDCMEAAPFHTLTVVEKSFADDGNVTASHIRAVVNALRYAEKGVLLKALSLLSFITRTSKHMTELIRCGAIERLHDIRTTDSTIRDSASVSLAALQKFTRQEQRAFRRILSDTLRKSPSFIPLVKILQINQHRPHLLAIALSEIDARLPEHTAKMMLDGVIHEVVETMQAHVAHLPCVRHALYILHKIAHVWKAHLSTPVCIRSIVDCMAAHCAHTDVLENGVAVLSDGLKEANVASSLEKIDRMLIHREQYAHTRLSLKTVLQTIDSTPAPPTHREKRRRSMLDLGLYRGMDGTFVVASAQIKRHTVAIPIVPHTRYIYKAPKTRKVTILQRERLRPTRGHEPPPAAPAEVPHPVFVRPSAAEQAAISPPPPAAAPTAAPAEAERQPQQRAAEQPEALRAAEQQKTPTGAQPQPQPQPVTQEAGEQQAAADEDWFAPAEPPESPTAAELPPAQAAAQQPSEQPGADDWFAESSPTAAAAGEEEEAQWFGDEAEAQGGAPQSQPAAAAAAAAAAEEWFAEEEGPAAAPSAPTAAAPALAPAAAEAEEWFAEPSAAADEEGETAGGEEWFAEPEPPMEARGDKRQQGEVAEVTDWFGGEEEQKGEESPAHDTGRVEGQREQQPAADEDWFAEQPLPRPAGEQEGVPGDQEWFAEEAGGGEEMRETPIDEAAAADSEWLAQDEQAAIQQPEDKAPAGGEKGAPEQMSEEELTWY